MCPDPCDKQPSPACGRGQGEGAYTRSLILIATLQPALIAAESSR
jgi:hypothetical protein